MRQVEWFFKDNPNLLMLKSDKGGVTVTMDAVDYDRGMREIIDNHDNFITLK